MSTDKVDIPIALSLQGRMTVWPTSALGTAALIEIGCVVTSLVGCVSLVGCHACALWPNGAS